MNLHEHHARSCENHRLVQFSQMITMASAMIMIRRPLQESFGVLDVHSLQESAKNKHRYLFWKIWVYPEIPENHNIDKNGHLKNIGGVPGKYGKTFEQIGPRLKII